MQPLRLLQCLARALVRHGGNALGVGAVGDALVGVGEEVWNEWKHDRDEQALRDEIAAIVQMAADQFRQEVAKVVREMAGEQPPEVRQRVSRWLEAVPDQLRLSLRRPADPTGHSALPALPISQPRDLASLLSGSASPLPPPARVTLTLTGQDTAGKLFVFEERTSCIIGREKQCVPRFPSDKEYNTISRYHCLLDINPPDICVRDLGSLGGTYVNNELLDRRPTGMERDEALKRRFQERNLKDGDEIKLCKHGAAIIQVSVTVPTLCADCRAWIRNDRKAGCERAPGVYRCEACHAPTAVNRRPRPLRACARCGQDVAGAAGSNRAGEFLCTTCRQDAAGIVRDLQGQAWNGQGDVGAIQGYTILKELGRGGMGSVWLGRKDSTGQLAAIKIMLPQVAADERAVKRFLGEMATTRMLKHPNVVRLGDAGFAHGTFFMVLDYCDGGSVSDLMKKRGGTLPLDEAVEITLQALEGLQYAHNVFGPGRGLVHRDLKPANLFLSGTGSSRVTRVGDYGLAKAFDDAGLSGGTRTGEAAGTPHYIPRQQVIDFKCAEPEVDVWAMAASLYDMLTGKVPRDFPEERDPWLVVMQEPVVAIRQRKATLPRKLADVIDRGLVEEPEIGFKTAAEFKEALEDAL